MLSRLLRQRVASWVAPLAATISLPADVLTVIGVIIAAAAGVFFALGAFPLAALAVAVSGMADILDGAVARRRNDGPSKRGAFFDSAADRLSDNLIYCGILVFYAFGPSPDPVAVIAAFIAASASNVASYVKCQAAAADVPCSAGLFKRQERFVVLILGGFLGAETFVVALLILAVFAVESMTRRLIYVYRRVPRSG